MSRSTQLESSRRAQRGVAMVELALITIPMILLTLAVIDLARVMYSYNTLAKATRDATRLLSGYDPSVPSQYPIDVARNLAVFGTTTNTGTPLLPGLTTSMVQICDRTTAADCPGLSFNNVGTGTGTINLVAVQISGYVFQPWFPAAKVLPESTYTFEPIRTTMRQVL